VELGEVLAAAGGCGRGEGLNNVPCWWCGAVEREERKGECGTKVAVHALCVGWALAERRGWQKLYLSDMNARMI
jgi:hypothetical protein